jgi:hypothetical protein
MAFILSNLLSSLDSSIGLLDSSSDLLEVLQALNVTNSTKGHGKSQKRTYDTVASLPTATSALRGSFATVETVGGFWRPPEDTDNGLYLCNGSDWTLIQGLDSADTPAFQGSYYGYASGGLTSNVIEKFTFSTDANATDVGDLTSGRYCAAGQSSHTHGYASGGWDVSNSNVIEKFTFSADANATDVGDLTEVRQAGAGQSSTTHGYTSAGSATIDKFSFSADGNATDVGDLTVIRERSTGQSSTTHGYTSGGRSGPTKFSVIDKFPFSSDANATNVGSLTQGRYGVAGQSSTTHGYTTGGQGAGGSSNVIDKFPFASNGNATDVGDLTVARYGAAGQSSTTHGYSSGGFPTTGPSGFPGGHVIDKFPFASGGNATDVGDLTLGRYGVSGQQY